MMKQKKPKQNKIKKTILFNIVFNSKISKTTIMVLFAFLCIQPIAPVFANELEGNETEVNIPIKITAEEIPESDSPQEESVAEDELMISQEEHMVVDGENDGKELIEEAEVTEIVSIENNVVIEQEVSTTGSVTGHISEADLANEFIEVTDSASSTQIETISPIIRGVSTSTENTAELIPTTSATNATTTSTSTVDIDEQTENSETDVSTGDQQENEYLGDRDVVGTEDPAPFGEEDISTSTVSTVRSKPATSTALSATTSLATGSVVLNLGKNTDTLYQFDDTECVEVSDGAYYCSEVAITEDTNIDDALYADRDADGDFEIFLARNGNVTQISHNIFDDRAPYYDAQSETIVWHRLIDGRYQVVSYDVKTGTESVLTSNTVNDMEPTRYGEITVWQRWVSDNWEIMMQEGIHTIQLTTNNVHDLAPKVSDTHIMWYSTGKKGNKIIKVYDLKTKEIKIIEDVEGGDINNVRLVLVFDTVFGNGDVITQGYDLSSQELIHLASLPGELPEKIPESDSTGETRALIQNKSNSIKNDIADTDDDGIINPPLSASSTAAELSKNDTSTGDVANIITLDLDISASSTDDVQTEMSLSRETTSAEVDHIPDVVIQSSGTTTDAETG